MGSPSRKNGCLFKKAGRRGRTKETRKMASNSPNIDFCDSCYKCDDFYLVCKEFWGVKKIEVFKSFSKEYIEEVSKKSQEIHDKWKNCIQDRCELSHTRYTKNAETPDQCVLCDQKDYYVRMYRG